MNCADCGQPMNGYFLSLHAVLCRVCWQKDSVSILPGDYQYLHSDLTVDDGTPRPDLGRYDVKPDSN